MSKHACDDAQLAPRDLDDCIDLATTLTMDEIRDLLAGAVSTKSQDELAEILLAGKKPAC